MKRFLGCLLTIGSWGVLSACAASSVSSRSALTTVELNVVPQGAQPSVSKPCQPESGPTNILSGALPVPGQMPSGSSMGQIARRRQLNVGCDQNPLFWGYRKGSDLEGFDIDMVRQIAKAIFGPSY